MNLIRNVTGFNIRRASLLFAGLLVCAAALGCGDEEEARPPGDGIALLDRDLGMGSQGGDVEALHRYLTRFGYFPNPALAKQYPAWRPRVASAPAAAWTYDERTADAVRALQRTGGLPTTGVVDEATRRLLKTPRCGVPDGHAPSGSEKYAFIGKWSKTALTYQVMNTDDVTLTQAQQEIAAAFASWAAQTNLTFSHVTGTQVPDIKINFTTIDGPAGFAAVERGQPGVDMPIFIDVDVAETWSILVRTPPGQLDLQTVMLHEIGHALGLAHSGFSAPTPTMFPFVGSNDRSLDLDDKVAISALYDAWQKMPGGARDIAVGADGSIWKVGSNLVPGGFGIHKWNGSGWTSAGGVGVRIAVTPSGIPWIIRGDGALFRRTSSSPTSGTWEQVPNAMARDIGIGADGSVWVVGINSVDGGSNFQLWKLNPATTFWTATDGAGVRVTVDSGGRPWLVNSFGGAWRRTTNDPTSGSWENLGGEFDDIAISDGNYAWAVRHLPEGVVGLWFWNEQPAIGDTAPARFEWKSNVILIEGSTSGTGSSVGAGPGGKPYVVHFNGNGATFRTTK